MIQYVYHEESRGLSMASSRRSREQQKQLAHTASKFGDAEAARIGNCSVSSIRRYRKMFNVSAFSKGTVAQEADPHIHSVVDDSDARSAGTEANDRYLSNDMMIVAQDVRVGDNIRDIYVMDVRHQQRNQNDQMKYYERVAEITSTRENGEIRYHFWCDTGTKNRLRAIATAMRGEPVELGTPRAATESSKGMRLHQSSNADSSAETHMDTEPDVSEERVWPRIRDLPADEREEFEKELAWQTRPMLTGVPPAEQDGYYPWDYERWKAAPTPYDDFLWD